MAQRNSEYERQDRDLYETPEWVTETLIPHIPSSLNIWEPSCGSGKMLRALQKAGHTVTGTDIDNGDDFLQSTYTGHKFNAIITNPPYGRIAPKFIDKAFEHMEQNRGIVAMLLKTDFDHGKTRKHMFMDCSAFQKKIVLLKRIVWFENPGGAGPSENHAWFVWNFKHIGPPTIVYEPR